MAELLVQRKKRSPLPWILLLLAVLAVAGYLIWRNQQAAHSAPANTTQQTTTNTTTTTTGTPSTQ